MTSTKMAITLSTFVTRNPEPTFADVGDCIVLMSVQQGKYYDLDAISSDVWRHLTRTICVADLCRTLADSYEGDSVIIETDVLALLNQFAEQGLIDSHPA